MLLNRRFFYSSLSDFDKLPLHMEEIEVYLKYQKKLQAIDSDFIIYGENSHDFKIGKFVIGHDGNPGEGFLTLDLGPAHFTQEEWKVESFSQLKENLTNAFTDFYFDYFECKFVSLEKVQVRFCKEEK